MKIFQTPILVIRTPAWGPPDWCLKGARVGDRALLCTSAVARLFGSATADYAKARLVAHDRKVAGAIPVWVRRTTCPCGCGKNYLRWGAGRTNRARATAYDALNKCVFRTPWAKSHLPADGPAVRVWLRFEKVTA